MRFLITPSQALRNVFITPRFSPRCTTRPFAPSGFRFYTRRERPLMDDQITASSIRLVDGKGGLTPAQFRSRILSSYDKRTHHLVLLQTQRVEQEPGQPPTQLAICRLISKVDFVEQERAAERAARENAAILARKNQTKVLELNWAIDKNDLSHRMVRLKEFLQKGMKVEVLLASKRRKRKATEEEARNTLATVKETAREVDAREFRDMQGSVGGMVQLFYRGKGSEE